MKSLSRSAILLVSVLLVLLVPYIPHHHHHGEVCMERVQCAHDLEYNDSHTGHDAEDTHDAGTCVKHVVALQIVQRHSSDESRSSDISMLWAIAGLEGLQFVQWLRHKSLGEGCACLLPSCIVVHQQLRAPPSAL